MTEVFFKGRAALITGGALGMGRDEALRVTTQGSHRLGRLAVVRGDANWQHRAK